MLKKAFLALAFLAGTSAAANAACYPDVVGGTPSGTCTTQTTYLHNGVAVPVDDGSHPFPVNASVTASIAGFAPGDSYATQTAPSGSSSVATNLPTGAVAVFFNTGSNPISLRLGSSAATANNNVIQASSWLALTVGVNTQFTVYGIGGASTVVASGGTGLPTGAGGGSSGGGSSGAVFGPTAVGSAAANPPVLAGGTVDGTATGNVGVLKIVSGVGSVNTAQVNGVTTLTGAGATGTGSQRNTVAQDTTTVAGAAPLTTGIFVTGPSAAALATGALQTSVGATAHTDAAAINTTLGTPFQAGGSIGNTAFTANAGTNLNTSALGLDSHLTNTQSVPGMPQTVAQTIQGNASGVPVPVTSGVAQGSTTSGQTLALTGVATLTSPPTYTTAQTNPVTGTVGGAIRNDLASVNGTTALAGAGATGAGAARVTVAQDATTNAGAPPGRTYNTIAASQSAQALTGGGGGATGDYLSFCVVIPTSTSPGVVTILDNSTTIYAFPGGASSLSNLVPFTIPVGALSTSGAWKITTGASLSAVCVGKFT